MDERSHGPDRQTAAAYERWAAQWTAARRSRCGDEAVGLAAAAVEPGPIVDLGCGPGWDIAGLDRPAIALDRSAAMLDLVPRYAKDAIRVRASIDALPFRARSLAGALSSRSHVHLRSVEVPAALADLHRCLGVDAPAFLHLFDDRHGADHIARRRFGERWFSGWNPDRLGDVLTGAGFEAAPVVAGDEGDNDGNLRFRLRRLRTLPDWVGSDMQLLICGLNPSLHAADAGVGFVSASNRFWPAAVDAGLVPSRVSPRTALRDHGIGMTDLVKRATRRADELTAAEYRAGLARIERLVEWLRPGAVCFVGLSGWRAAVDRRAVAGPLDRRLGGRPVHLMPSTSGLNARVGRAELADHLRAAAELAERSL